MDESLPEGIVTLGEDQAVWQSVFIVAPLVLVGTKEEDGTYDLAPKHMATPLGWERYFGFVCTPEHRTYWNARREGVFTVSYPRPRQVVLTSLAASPRVGEGQRKPALEAIPTFPAREVDGVHVRDGYLFLECELDRVIDDLGANSLLIGRVVLAHVLEEAMRLRDRDEQEVIAGVPLLAYLSPGRWARIEESNSFPFHLETD
ncbi:MAG: flavin reductase [Gemmatimonadota bacterium]